ncbi:Protein of unknown function [Pyronema omphalodes CBS 100304]|uniref:Uncharacterized protein n=1 Tax=Pyronema omphalodes (strain CBS 100304) TaxID=1076935 RepID=U4LXR8_PYROM|nr:Protein of unknown function [Pyronema omphalodes CBS 100304]
MLVETSFTLQNLQASGLIREFVSYGNSFRYDVDFSLETMVIKPGQSHIYSPVRELLVWLSYR